MGLTASNIVAILEHMTTTQSTTAQPATIYLRKKGSGFCTHYQITADCHETGEVTISRWYPYRETAEKEIGVTVIGDYSDAPHGADFHMIAEGTIS